MHAAHVKRSAKECGADIVGITPMERFEGAPKHTYYCDMLDRVLVDNGEPV